MTVHELLRRMPSRELSEWVAYEQFAGPLGGDWRDNALAAIHEEMQGIARLIGAQYKDNPAPEPKEYPRPRDWFPFLIEKYQLDDGVEPEED